MSEYKTTTKEISAIEGIEVDITIRGDEDKSGHVMMDLKERLGILAAAYDFETTPENVQDMDEGLPSDYKPFMTVNWTSVFEEEDDE